MYLLLDDNPDPHLALVLSTVDGCPFARLHVFNAQKGWVCALLQGDLSRNEQATRNEDRAQEYTRQESSAPKGSFVTFQYSTRLLLLYGCSKEGPCLPEGL